MNGIGEINTYPSERYLKYVSTFATTTTTTKNPERNSPFVVSVIELLPV